MITKLFGGFWIIMGLLLIWANAWPFGLFYVIVGLLGIIFLNE